jgi:hypothetical protein
METSQNKAGRNDTKSTSLLLKLHDNKGGLDPFYT